VLRQAGLSIVDDEDASLSAGQMRLDVVEDDDFAAALAWGRHGPLHDQLLAEIAKYNRAALIEYGGLLHQDPKQVARVGRALRDAGGAAVRMEASGGASAWEPWLERLESGDPFDVYETAALVVHDDDSLMFTCGMHHFDLPDAQIDIADPGEAIAWLDTFCAFQIAEQPTLASGHTFAPDADAERRVLERWPDHRHDPADGRHNPFGIWRLLPPTKARVEAREPIPTIIPPLVATLAALEAQHGTALTRQQVENVTANSSAIAMQLQHALALERSRGYADIEPELAWEQWQIVRTAF